MNLLNIFSSEDFMPHGHCFLWRPDLMSLHIISDAIIAISYYTIPFALIYFVIKRPDVMFRPIALLFGIFILACGTTHVLGIVVLWHPIYWVDGGVKAITAIASIATGVIVWRIMPQALAVPSTAELQSVVVNLGHEVTSRRRAEEEVRSLNAVLEERVQDRTRELEKSNAELKTAIEAKEVLLREVHHRVKNNLQVVTALLAMQSDTASAELKPYFQDSASRIEAMGRVHNQLHRAPDVAALDLGDYLKVLAEDLARIYGRKDIVAAFSLPADIVWIDFDVANPLVLLLSEALSNVFKHAFPNGRSGTVRISLEATSSGPEVTIADDGIGVAAAPPPERGSMGMNLIRMLAQQIGATIDFTYENGTTFRVRLPRSIVLDRT
ncbi:MAG TPA: sensor histidine kinase [Reyranella sp.]|nr:sensor histidine kinase [Reyranella sp.]